MQNINKNLVSVIIPCYNAALFINQTIVSILNQSHQSIELIIVDDGSTDESKSVINLISDNRIYYYYQKNNGVSSARNLGFQKSIGDFVVFFDADDIMSFNFIKDRLIHLNVNNQNAVCGNVIKLIGTHTYSEEVFEGAGANAITDILLYNKKTITCPSNYMFRRTFLINNRLLFNTMLNSTADRMFLLECAFKTTLLFSREIAPLFYRVNKKSMSGTLNYELLKDNIKYYELLITKNHIPENIVDKCNMQHYYIFMASAIKLKKAGLFFNYLFKLLRNKPLYRFSKK